MKAPAAKLWGVRSCQTNRFGAAPGASTAALTGTEAGPSYSRITAQAVRQSKSCTTATRASPQIRYLVQAQKNRKPKQWWVPNTRIAKCGVINRSTQMCGCPESPWARDETRKGRRMGATCSKTDGCMALIRRSAQGRPCKPTAACGSRCNLVSRPLNIALYM